MDRSSHMGIWANFSALTSHNGLHIFQYPQGSILRGGALAGLRHTRLHDLRHLHATELLRLGEPLHVVANRLGHRDAMVTATIYAHVSQEQTETASSRFALASETI